MLNIMNLSTILIIIGVLTFVTNVVTEVVKQFITSKKWTQVFVVIFSIVLTVVALIAYCQIKEVVIVWYLIVAAVICGLFVAYAAMYGYDTLKEMMLKFKNTEVK